MERYIVDITEVQVDALQTILDIIGSKAKVEHKLVAIKATCENCEAVTTWIKKEGKKVNG